VNFMFLFRYLLFTDLFISDSPYFMFCWFHFACFSFCSRSHLLDRKWWSRSVSVEANASTHRRGSGFDQGEV
jgi:hypothetical protein